MNILIIGAGISGLSLAWNLKKKHGNGAHIQIVEAQNRVGGWIRSIKEDGAVFECGPKALKWSEAVEFLLHELGIWDEAVFADPSQNTKYIMHQGKLEIVPNTILSALQSPFSPILLRGFAKSLFYSKKLTEDLSVEQFFVQVYGKAFFKTLIDPLIRGIYACNPQDLSMQMASNHLGMFLGKKMQKSKLFSFREGLEFLPRTIARKLDCDIELSTQVLSLREKGDRVEVVTDKKTYEVDQVYTTVSHVLPEAIHVPRTTVQVVSLGFQDAVLEYSGFGFLAPSHEEKDLLGITFDSKLFPSMNGAYKTRLTVMLQNTNDAEKYCKKYLGITEKPSFIHAFHAKQCIPIFPVDFKKELEKQKNQKIILTGMDTGSLSVTDCIEKALVF